MRGRYNAIECDLGPLKALEDSRLRPDQQGFRFDRLDDSPSKRLPA